MHRYTYLQLYVYRDSSCKEEGSYGAYFFQGVDRKAIHSPSAGTRSEDKKKLLHGNDDSSSLRGLSLL